MCSLSTSDIRDRPEDVAGVIRAFYRAVRYAQEYPEDACGSWRHVSGSIPETFVGSAKWTSPWCHSRTSSAFSVTKSRCRRSCDAFPSSCTSADSSPGRGYDSDLLNRPARRARGLAIERRQALMTTRGRSSTAPQGDDAAAGHRHLCGYRDWCARLLQHRGAAHAPAPLPGDTAHRHGQRGRRKPGRSRRSCSASCSR